MESIIPILGAVFFLAFLANKLNKKEEKSEPVNHHYDEVVNQMYNSQTNEEMNQEQETAKADTLGPMLNTLNQLGCQPAANDDGTLSVQYQGENFHMEFGGMYARVWDPMWAGVIDKNGNWVVTPEYEFVSDLAMDSCRVVKKNGLAGIVDYNGKALIEPMYDAVRIPNHGLANVAKDGCQKQIVVETGTVLRNFVFDDVAEFRENPTDEYQKNEVNNLWGAVRTRDFSIVIPAIYADVEYLSGNRFKGQLPEDGGDVTSNPNTTTISYVILDANYNILMGGL